MSAQTARLARLFTVEYARRINAQIVYPAKSLVVKPNELESALARPANVAFYEPHRPPAYLAASLAYGIIKGHPFQDGNKRTALFLGNQYVRVMGLPGLAEGEFEEAYQEMAQVARRFMDVAAGKLDVAGLANLPE